MSLKVKLASGDHRLYIIKNINGRLASGGPQMYIIKNINGEKIEAHL